MKQFGVFKMKQFGVQAISDAVQDISDVSYYD